MNLLPHYFTRFQAFVIQESENERLRFDLRVGLEILRREAEYRAGEPTRQGIFDRLAMLASDENSIDRLVAFPEERA